MSHAIADMRHQSKTHQGYLRIFALFFVITLLSIHSGFRGEVNDLDSVAYFGWYAELQRLYFQQFFERVNYFGFFYDDGLNSFEIGFSVLGFLAANLGLSAAQFLFSCAVFSIAAKISCLFRYFRDPLVLFSCIAWYLCWQYLLMEMNAVRIGVALAVVLLGFEHLLLGRSKALIYIAAASLFHISAILLVVFVIFSRFPILRKSVFLYILGASIFVGYLPIHELVYLLFGGFEKISTYYVGVIDGNLFSEINRFNALTLLRLVIFFVVLYNYRPFAEGPVSKLGFYGLWISLCCYFAFASLPVLAGRLSELFGFFSVFVIGRFIKGVRPAAISGAFILLVSALQFYAIVFYSRLVNVFYFIDSPLLSVDLFSVAPL